ncbi:MAG: hypothetical protein WCK74_03725 [Gemmatimonadaceae bacterium]
MRRPVSALSPAHWLAVSMLLSVVACQRAGDSSARREVAGLDSATADSVARARQDSINRARPDYIVDSILPVEEQLRRFRMAIGGEPLTRLQHASPSRDALVKRFMQAVAASDSTALVQMVVTAREFADLVYPESPNTKPPYQQDPALTWRTIQNPSGTGYRRLLRRAGGMPIILVSYRCDPKPGQQGRNRFWTHCLLQLKDEKGQTSTHRFFGNILERDGQFKFMSYSNEF